MSNITYHYADGTEKTVEVADGVSVMRAALSEGVPGIIGECGGQAMCATCHVLVRPEYLDALPPVSEDEDEMLDCTAVPRDDERSRLGCQIHVGAELPHIDVDVPERQR
ncbi:MAG TPA: 2Fe-2S iron-sulfur cluster-binding protein [Pseudolysinimonas sp.]|nr:2Fe-2S iron-sulfur cluster-binding protein [Pseudolysinimonas sp.]